MNGQNKWILGIFSALGYIVVLVLFVGLSAGIIWLIYFLFTSNPNLLLGLVLGLTPTAVTIWQYKQQTKLEHKQWLLRDRDACLIETIDVFVSLLQEQKKTNSKQQVDKFLERFKDLRIAVFTHGSASTLKAWDVLMVEMVKQSQAAISQVATISENETLRAGERFFRTIRRDLGHDDSDLQPGELWGTLFDEELKKKALKACKDEDYSYLYKKDK